MRVAAKELEGIAAVHSQASSQNRSDASVLEAVVQAQRSMLVRLNSEKAMLERRLAEAQEEARTVASDFALVRARIAVRLCGCAPPAS